MDGDKDFFLCVWTIKMKVLILRIHYAWFNDLLLSFFNNIKKL